MEFLIDLWLPILIVTFVLWMGSFICWVVLPHHFPDKKMLNDEQEVMDLVKRLKIPPGNYMFPYSKQKAEQNTKEFQARYEEGPVGCLDVYGKLNMGKNMALTILFFLVTTAIIAYITHFACPPAADKDFMRVFRIAGTIGILTHASSGILNAIWFSKKKLMDVIDGTVYGILLGLIFALMWPTTG